MPSRLLTSVGACGSLACLMAATFLGSAEIPSAEKMNPKNSRLDLSNSHFLRLSVRPLSFSLWNTALRVSSCSACVLPWMMMSSLRFLTPLIPCNVWHIAFWNTSAADDIPKFRRLYRLRPWCVVKVVMHLLAGWSSK